MTNLLEIFFCFSNFTSLHHVLLSNKIGDLTMRVIDLELRRYDLRIREEKGKKPSQKFAQFLSKQERLLYVAGCAETEGGREGGRGSSSRWDEVDSDDDVLYACVCVYVCMHVCVYFHWSVASFVLTLPCLAAAVLQVRLVLHFVEFGGGRQHRTQDGEPGHHCLFGAHVGTPQPRPRPARRFAPVGRHFSQKTVCVSGKQSGNGMGNAGIGKNRRGRGRGWLHVARMCVRVGC